MRPAGALVIVRTVDAEAVVAELSRVFDSRDWPRVRALYHPDALILTVMGGATPLAPDELVDRLRMVSEDFLYSVNGSPPVPLDEHAVIVTGRMRRRLEQGGFEDAGHLWLLTTVDGLIYRQGVYHDQEAAVAAYRQLGIGLGLG